MSGIPKEILTVRTRLQFIGLIIFCVALVFQLQETGDIDLGLATSTPNTVGVYYKVSKVTDGDTINVIIDGTEEKVRLIGIRIHIFRPVLS